MIVPLTSSIRLTSFQRKPYRRTSDDLFVLDCSRRACARSPPGPALIRPVNRMDGLARTSLKPIRCTERETAFPSSVMLYVTMAGREYRAALYPMHAFCFSFALFLTRNPPLPFCPPPSCLSLPCLYTLSSHTRCYLVVLLQDVAELHFLLQQIKGRIPRLGLLGTVQQNLNCFLLLLRIPWRFIIKFKEIAKKKEAGELAFLRTLLIIL